MSEINTGGGSTIGEGVNTDGGDFNNRDKTENANNLSVYFTSPPPEKQERERRTLSMSAESSLKEEIRELRQTIGTLSTEVHQAINYLSENVRSLDKTMAVENGSLQYKIQVMGIEVESAKSRLDTIQSLVDKLDNPVPLFDERLLRSIFYSLIAIVGLLVVIAWLLSGRGVFN